VIQVPTYLPAGYRFDASEYEAQTPGGMEMHPLPQREVFAIARAAGVDVLEVLEDGWTGYGAGSAPTPSFCSGQPDPERAGATAERAYPPTGADFRSHAQACATMVSSSACFGRHPSVARARAESATSTAGSPARRGPQVTGTCGR